MTITNPAEEPDPDRPADDTTPDGPDADSDVDSSQTPERESPAADALRSMSVNELRRVINDPDDPRNEEAKAVYRKMIAPMIDALTRVDTSNFTRGFTQIVADASRNISESLKSYNFSAIPTALDFRLTPGLAAAAAVGISQSSTHTGLEPQTLPLVVNRIALEDRRVTEVAHEFELQATGILRDMLDLARIDSVRAAKERDADRAIAEESLAVAKGSRKAALFAAWTALVLGLAGIVVSVVVSK